MFGSLLEGKILILLYAASSWLDWMGICLGFLVTRYLFLSMIYDR